VNYLCQENWAKTYIFTLKNPKEYLECSSRRGKNDFKPKGIFVEANRNGKMNKSHLQRLYEYISGENIEEKALLLLDF
jgi:hypothetical protein